MTEHDARDAGTGRYVSDEYAAEHPETTVVETRAVSSPFATFERLETCHRVEVTLDNLHVLAQHFGGEAIYRTNPDGNWQTKKPRLVISKGGITSSTIEVGAWVDEQGNRWNPEPLTQDWRPEGTYLERATVAATVRRNCTPSGEAYAAGGDSLITAVADWIENPPEWVTFR